MSKDIIIIDGVRYHSDRPSSCRGCYFWKNRKVGCTLGKENCYYLAESPKKKSPCESPPKRKAPVKAAATAPVSASA